MDASPQPNLRAAGPPPTPARQPALARLLREVRGAMRRLIFVEAPSTPQQHTPQPQRAAPSDMEDDAVRCCLFAD